MDPVKLKAHFDGERIQLDEPYELPTNTPLMVTVLRDDEEERAEWSEIAKRGLARAYSDDEPVYTLDDIIP